MDLTKVLNPGQQLREEEDPDIWSVCDKPPYEYATCQWDCYTPAHLGSHELPVASPDLLRLHAAIARVVRCARASGEKQGDDYCGEDDESEAPALEIDSMGEEEVDSVDRKDGEELEDSAVVGNTLPAPWILRHRSSNVPRMSFALRRFMREDSEDTLQTKKQSFRTGTEPYPTTWGHLHENSERT